MLWGNAQKLDEYCMSYIHSIHYNKMKKYKVIVNLNRIQTPYKEDFKKAHSYHMRHGIDIEFIFKQVDIHGYQSISYTHPNGFRQYLIKDAENFIELDKKADANMFIFDMEEWATPPGSKYPLKPETPNGSCVLVDGKPFICVGTHKIDHQSGQTWIQIAHELMHSYVQNASMKGIKIKDVMDTYRLNSDPENPQSNFTEQWVLLEPYFKMEGKT